MNKFLDTFIFEYPIGNTIADMFAPNPFPYGCLTAVPRTGTSGANVRDGRVVHNVELTIQGQIRWKNETADTTLGINTGPVRLMVILDKHNNSYLNNDNNNVLVDPPAFEIEDIHALNNPEYVGTRFEFLVDDIIEPPPYTLVVQQASQTSFSMNTTTNGGAELVTDNQAGGVLAYTASGGRFGPPQTFPTIPIGQTFFNYDPATTVGHIYSTPLNIGVQEANIKELKTTMSELNIGYQQGSAKTTVHVYRPETITSFAYCIPLCFKPLYGADAGEITSVIDNVVRFAAIGWKGFGQPNTSVDVSYVARLQFEG